MNTVQPMYEWNTLPWRKIERNVFKLQKRIYQASRRGDVEKVRKLQKLLTKSWSARTLATRRVTQDNSGKKTAGIDGLASLSPKIRLILVESLRKDEGKPAPTRRVWIDKPGTDEKRPLGIPTIFDRAKQALLKIALEPEWEARFEPNSYGFRPGRSSHDAIEAIFAAIRMKPKYVLDADITKCFDRINHDVLLNKLNSSPWIKRQVRAWLKAGVIDNFKYHKTNEGTPQGGVISPLLANIALHGMENRIKQYAETLPGTKQVNRQAISLIRYADDFVILHENLEVVQKCQQIITDWLSEVGLELKAAKTRIGHTLEKVGDGIPGFDFLGFNIRQYQVSKYNSGKRMSGYKTLIKPSKKAVIKQAKKIREVIRSKKAAPQKAVISKLNPMIRGWANYYSSTISRKYFEVLDDLTHWKLWRWAKFRHPHKGEQWVKRKYFRTHGQKNWAFKEEEGSFLFSHSDVAIVRHVKIQGDRSPYDGDWVYWSSRMGKHPEIPKRVATLLKGQKGKCSQCGLQFKLEDLMEVHHLDKNRNNNKQANLALLHRHCHDRVHGSMNDNHQIVEEPDEVKVSRPVLKTSTLSDGCAEFI
jgi:RNA-directed DNA polymerase